MRDENGLCDLQGQTVRLPLSDTVHQVPQSVLGCVLQSLRHSKDQVLSDLSPITVRLPRIHKMPEVWEFQFRPVLRGLRHVSQIAMPEPLLPPSSQPSVLHDVWDQTEHWRCLHR